MRRFLILPADIDTDPVFRKRGAASCERIPVRRKHQARV